MPTIQRHSPSSRWTLLMAILVIMTKLSSTLAYKVNLPKTARPSFQTRLSEHKKEKKSSHEETYALRRPPKKRSSASKVAMTSTVIDHHSTVPTFETRMRNLVLGDVQKQKKPRVAAQSNLPANIKLVATLEEYKQVVGEEREKIVVARFYAPWCKACRSIQPMYYRLANKFTNVVFVEVPVTEENAALHQGLGVPSLPYAHMYEPSTGLVEELKISRTHISDFANKLQSYVTGSCELTNNCENPYSSQEADEE